jgi:T-complex protein 1 subunit delta
VTITNDGATILEKLKVQHPAAKMFVELSKSQDVEAGDGTTSVVVLAGALAGAAESLLDKGIHPAVISTAFLKAERRAQEVLRDMSLPIERLDEEHLLAAATTSLNSKVVNQYSQTLAPIAVKAVLKVIDAATATNVDLRDIRVVQKLGGTVDDTELVDGLVFTHKTKQAPGAPHLVKDAKIALLQFCLSAPKTNIENNVVISDYTQMDRLLKEERRIILDLCKAIQKTGANVLLIQKSILRDATSELALHFLAKLKIMVVADIERSDIEIICKNLGCQPIASVEGLSPAKLGRADLVEEESTSGGSIVRITGAQVDCHRCRRRRRGRRRSRRHRWCRRSADGRRDGHRRRECRDAGRRRHRRCRGRRRRRERAAQGDRHVGVRAGARLERAGARRGGALAA